MTDIYIMRLILFKTWEMYYYTMMAGHNLLQRVLLFYLLDFLHEATKQSSSHDRYGGRRIATKLRWQARNKASQVFSAIEDVYRFWILNIQYNDII